MTSYHDGDLSWFSSVTQQMSGKYLKFGSALIFTTRFLRHY